MDESIPIPFVEQRSEWRCERAAITAGKRAPVCQSPQQGGPCAAEHDRLAVYVERNVIVKKLRRAVEYHPNRRRLGDKSPFLHQHRRRRKTDDRLRLGQEGTEKAPDVARL